MIKVTNNDQSHFWVRVLVSAYYVLQSSLSLLADGGIYTTLSIIINCSLGAPAPATFPC